MKPHLQTLVKLLTAQDLKGLLKHYLVSEESENISQLGFMFQQAQKNPEGYAYYQELAGTFIAAKGLPKSLIAKINSSDVLSFFTPALQGTEHFKTTDINGRNVVHYLLGGVKDSQPPFNYLRSLMLFESNESLHQALTQRDKQNLTPIEVYFAFNKNLSALPNHEFTAVLAMIEIESKKQTVAVEHQAPILNTLKKLYFEQGIQMTTHSQRLQLMAAYFGQSVDSMLE